MLHVVFHAPQDGRCDVRFLVAPIARIAMYFLDPLEVDDRNHADEQVGKLGDVALFGDHGAMQSFVEQHVRVLRKIFPFGERAGGATVQCSLFLVVHIVTTFTRSRLAVLLEEATEIAKQVGLGAEMTDVFTALFCRGNRVAHLCAIVPVVTVALDDRGADVESPEDMFEGGLDRRSPGAGGAGDGNNWVLLGHCVIPVLSAAGDGPAFHGNYVSIC